MNFNFRVVKLNEESKTFKSLKSVYDRISKPRGKFINDGQEVFTTRLYGKLSNQNIEFLTENKGEVFFYPLKGYTIIKND